MRTRRHHAPHRKPPVYARTLTFSALAISLLVSSGCTRDEGEQRTGATGEGEAQHSAETITAEGENNVGDNNQNGVTEQTSRAGESAMEVAHAPEQQPSEPTSPSDEDRTLLFDMSVFESEEAVRNQAAVLIREGERHLELMNCDADCVTLLDDTGLFDAIASLTLLECTTAESADAYLATGGHANLRSLGLEGCAGFSDSEEATLLGDDHVRRLAALPTLSGLESLSLARQGVCSEGLRALADSAHLDRLQALDISHNTCLSDGALATFFEEVSWPGLRELNIRSTGAGELAMQALLASEGFPDLESIGLNNADELPAGLVEELRRLVSSCQPQDTETP